MMANSRLFQTYGRRTSRDLLSMVLIYFMNKIAAGGRVYNVCILKHLSPTHLHHTTSSFHYDSAMRHTVLHLTYKVSMQLPNIILRLTTPRLHDPIHGLSRCLTTTGDICDAVVAHSSYCVSSAVMSWPPSLQTLTASRRMQSGGSPGQRPAVDCAAC